MAGFFEVEEEYAVLGWAVHAQAQYLLDEGLDGEDATGELSSAGVARIKQWAQKYRDFDLDIEELASMLDEWEDPRELIP